MSQHYTVRRFRNALGIAVALAFAGLTAAHADDAAGARTVTVRYDDLNLGTDNGVQTLYARLTRAANQVCPNADARDLARAAIAHACQSQAVDAAIRQVNSPRLATLHAQRAFAG